VLDNQTIFKEKYYARWSHESKIKLSLKVYLRNFFPKRAFHFATGISSSEIVKTHSEEKAEKDFHA